MIFVTTGTQKFQFDRLLRAVDHEVECRHITEEVFAQSGASTYKPKNYRCQSFLSQQEMADWRRKADLIVTHGGTNSIIEGLRLRIPVVAVPRLARYQEHVDDHQKEIIEEMSSEGLIVGVSDLTCLYDAILKAREMVLPVCFRGSGELVRYIDSICQEVERCTK